MKNSQLGDVLTIRDAATKLAEQGERKNWLTVGDLMFGGLGGAAGLVSHDPLMAAKFLAAKKAIDASKTSGARTTTGYLLRSAGENPLISPAFDIWSRKFVKDQGRKSQEGQ